MTRRDREPVTVIFRAERSGAHKGEVTAVFPYVEGCPGYMTCYAHVGQHGSCGMLWYWQTRPATPAEYTSLLAELRRIGYAPRVARRINHKRRKGAAWTTRTKRTRDEQRAAMDAICAEYGCVIVPTGGPYPAIEVLRWHQSGDTRDRDLIRQCRDALLPVNPAAKHYLFGS
jgi:hypothetical protein